MPSNEGPVGLRVRLVALRRRPVKRSDPKKSDPSDFRERAEDGRLKYVPADAFNHGSR